MSKLVRAKHPTTGATFTTSEAHATRNKLETVDEPTHDRFGRIRPDTPAPVATDVESVNRKELEDRARAAGLDDAAIKAARTKADLAAAIDSHGQEG